MLGKTAVPTQNALQQFGSGFKGGVIAEVAQQGQRTLIRFEGRIDWYHSVWFSILD